MRCDWGVMSRMCNVMAPKLEIEIKVVFVNINDNKTS